MNFYDKVDELIRSLKDTSEYREFLSLKSKIKSDDKLYNLMKEFKEKQQKQQFDYLNTGKIDENMQKELENLYSIIIQNNDMRSMLEYEMRINVLLADMQKSIGDSIKEIIEF